MGYLLVEKSLLTMICQSVSCAAIISQKSFIRSAQNQLKSLLLLAAQQCFGVLSLEIIHLNLLLKTITVINILCFITKRCCNVQIKTALISYIQLIACYYSHQCAIKILTVFTRWPVMGCILKEQSVLSGVLTDITVALQNNCSLQAFKMPESSITTYIININPLTPVPNCQLFFDF